MSDDIDDVLDGESTPKTKKGKPAKKTAKADKAEKPAKKAAKADKAEKPAKKAAKADKTEKPAKPKKVVDSNISMTQPEDSVTLKAVRKLKEPTLAASFALEMGVHRRVLRAQLQRLAKDKANGVSMKKTGAHWIVANTAK